MPNKLHPRYLPIAQDSPSRAAAFIETIAKRVGRLETHPMMGRVPRNEYLKRLGYRVLIVEHYLAFYLLRGQVVEVHRVLHGSRHFDEIL